jgi:TfoX/Sxy family transcriptional regulator of competence genes
VPKLKGPVTSGSSVAFDEALASRVRDALKGTDGLVEKRMFGGLAFLLNGNMCCGVRGDELIVRLDPEQTEAALRQRGVRVFDLSGRPMKGWVLVAAAGIETDDDLRAWVDKGVAFARSLRPK